jgi:hypothetical protein
MITSEIKVNGDLVGHVYCVNILNPTRDGRYQYKVTFYDVSDRITDTFKLYHDRLEGFDGLMLKIWQEIFMICQKRRIEKD